jgi:hypothetical protein
MISSNASRRKHCSFLRLFNELKSTSFIFSRIIGKTMIVLWKISSSQLLVPCISSRRAVNGVLRFVEGFVVVKRGVVVFEFRPFSRKCTNGFILIWVVRILNNRRRFCGLWLLTSIIVLDEPLNLFESSRS